MNLLDYPPEQLRRPIVGRTILLRLEIWTGRMWAEARFAGLITQPFGSMAWGEAMRTVNALRLGLYPERKRT
jgi:hypothetical protein